MIKNLDNQVLIQIVLIIFMSHLLIHKGLIKLFKLENYQIIKKRQAQLDFSTKKEKNETRMIVEKTSQPIIKYFGKYINIHDEETINRNLKFIGWNKYMTAIEFKAMQIAFIIIGIVMFLVFKKISFIMATALGVFVAIIPKIMYKDKIKSKKQRLLYGFPDFIRITQGYLSAGFSFLTAVESSLPHLTGEWKEEIQELVIDMRLTNTRDALERFKERIDLFEVKEFVSVITLILDQGGDAEAGFDSQAESINEMMVDLMDKKISSRNNYAQALNPILLVAALLAFMLPIIYEMMEFSNM